jgi:hypothetical protein
MTGLLQWPCHWTQSLVGLKRVLQSTVKAAVRGTGRLDIETSKVIPATHAANVKRMKAIRPDSLIRPIQQSFASRAGQKFHFSKKGKSSCDPRTNLLQG